MDDDKIVKFTLENGELVSGSNTYCQFIIRDFRIEATEFSIIRRYYNQFEPDEASARLFRSDPRKSSINLSKAHVSVSILGKARIDQDSLSVIGDPELSTKEVSLEIREVEEEKLELEKFAWRARIFLLSFDWEIGTEDSWCVSMNLPRKAFDELATVIENKSIGSLSINLDTDLWTHDHDRHAVPAQDVKWYLRPDDKGRADRPESAHGIVTGLSWTNKPLTLDGVTKESSLLAAKTSGFSPAHELKDIPILARLGHVLGWLGNILAVLLLVVAIYAQSNRTISVPFPYPLNASQEPYLSATLPEIMLMIMALIFFITGRALRYIFAGRSSSRSHNGVGGKP
ncbi:MAG: hypothetical protein ABIU05_27580 [Nitrospirales bacterium]